jgi:hypothetical protein
VSEDGIGETVLLTAEELIAFAAARDLSPPPGILSVAVSLSESPSRDAVVALSARALLTRGVTPVASDGLAEPTQTAIDRLLTLACAPIGRVVVIVDGDEGVECRAFGFGREMAVISAWNSINVHAVRGCVHSEAVAAIGAAMHLEDIGPRGSGVTVTLPDGPRRAAVEDGPSAVRQLLTQAGGGGLAPEEVSALARLLTTSQPRGAVMFNRIEGPSPVARAYTWFEPCADGAWLAAELAPDGEVAEPSVRITHVGRTDLSRLVHDECMLISGNSG